MKIKIIAILSFFALLMSAVSANAQTEDKAINFYIRKNGHMTPVLAKELEMIEKYDAIYMDNESATKGNKVIYLTFDAGYENGNVERVLDVLKEESVPGAFFILGHIIR